MTEHKKGSRLSKGSNTNVNDRVMTPGWLAEKVIQWANVEDGDRVYEPCRGDGGFYDLLPPGTEWAEIDMGRDMFEYDPGGVDIVITNPPYSCLGDFLVHMMTEIKPRRMILLAPITNLVTKKRLRDTFNNGYGFGRTAPLRNIPYGWPATGFQHVVQEYIRDTEGWEYLECGRDG